MKGKSKNKIKKILLIYPPINIFDYEIRNYAPPLGLMYLTAVAEKKYDVRILDCVIEGMEHRINKTIRLGLTDDEIEDEIKRFDPDLVGISCLYSNQLGMTYNIAKIVKKVNKNIRTVIGGAHASALPKDTLLEKTIDYAIIGEGEISFLRLLDFLNGHGKIKNINGLAYRCKNKVIINLKTKYIKNLDSLPFPARHCLPMEKYFEKKSAHGFEQIGKRATSIISSRGCPFNCCFCSIHNIWGFEYRKRSAKNVIKEIVMLKEKYKIDEISFEDDNLTLDAKRIEELCDGLIKNKIKVHWTTPNGVYIHSMNEKLLGKMKKSGCYKLCFGIESGDANILKYMRKPVNLQKARDVIEICNKIGIWTHGFFVIGTPPETEKSINNTLKFANSSGLDFASFLIAMPYPGTDLEKDMKKIDYDKLKVMHATKDIKNFTADELNRTQKYLYSEFAKHKFFSMFNPVNLYNYLKKPSALKMFFRTLNRFLQISKK